MKTFPDAPSVAAPAASASNPLGARGLERLPILDGWRALSISLVMAGHLLPLGPKAWALNGAVASMGMVLFFTLSGFLITRFLIADSNLRRFLIRRVLRIVPLAWAGTVLAMIIAGGTVDELLGNLFFYANLPPYHLLPAAGHFWSLSVEVQFYVTIALLVALGGQRTLMLLPVLALVVTGLRILNGQHMNIITWYRIDEILAGATLALVYEGKFGERVRACLAWPNVFLMAPLVLLSCHPIGGALNYLRPYLSAWMVGASLLCAHPWMQALSRTKPVTYVAKTSYALYVFHGILADSWLGSGSKLIKYAKRPALILATLGLAHISTFHYESRWIGLARQMTKRGPNLQAKD